MSDAERKVEIARQIAQIEDGKETAKLELSYKDGKLVAATKVQPLLK